MSRGNSALSSWVHSFGIHRFWPTFVWEDTWEIRFPSRPSRPGQSIHHPCPRRSRFLAQFVQLFSTIRLRLLPVQISE